MSYQNLINEIKTLVLEQGVLIQKSFRSPEATEFLVKRQKECDDLDLVTALDRHVEQEIHLHLSKRFPELGFVLEERPELNDETKELICYIDPIDGTKYFAKDMPIFCVSVGILKNSEPVLGVIYNPVSGQLYAGAEGIPTTLNGKSISVSPVNKIENAILSLDMATKKRNWETDKNWMNQKLLEFNTKAKRVRLLGAGALSCAWVASGGLDGYVDIWGHCDKPFDIAAGKALIKYARDGKIVHLPIPSLADLRFVGGNPELVDRITEIMLD